MVGGFGLLTVTPAGAGKAAEGADKSILLNLDCLGWTASVSDLIRGRRAGVQESLRASALVRRWENTPFRSQA
jgi:hypothetical protein